MNAPVPPVSQFGRMDIYLFDQLQRGRIVTGMRILDAGSGSGRNLEYLMRAGYDVYAADEDPDAIAAVTALAEELAPEIPRDHFRVEPLDALTFPDHSMDVVISCAVLHFARDREHLMRMLHGSWRPLKAGGVFFARLASSIGIEEHCRPIDGDSGRYRLPNGEERFLVNEEMLADAAIELKGSLIDPLKTTLVQGQRSMTTWVLRKDG